MAGWISSKLKVAETFLQQIDQQAAESLGKNETPQSDELDEKIPAKSGGVVPLKDQLKKKTQESYDFQRKLHSDPNVNVLNSQDRDKEVTSPSKPFSSPRSNLTDSDWTELLSTPNQETPFGANRTNGTSGIRGLRKDGRRQASSGLNFSGLEAKRNYRSNNGASKPQRRSDVGPGNRENAGGLDRKLSDEKELGRSDSVDRTSSAELRNDGKYVEAQASELVLAVRDDANPERSGVKDSVEDGGRIISKGHSVDKNHLWKQNWWLKEQKRSGESNAGLGSSVSLELKGTTPVSDERSDSDTDSASSSDSESERIREERRRRRKQILAEKQAAKAVMAIKERENMVARLEGEKESLEKILEERAKQQAQEASELQTTMMETMEAVELEKQKHNNTRMEALARLAKLETVNADLARSLATAQWNLEVEVNRVAEIRQQIELKEVALEEQRRRISNAHQTGTSLSHLVAAKGVEFEKEILEAEYSFITDKIGRLQDKAKKLEANIEMTRKEMESPTVVEVELKRRLGQLTDHLIQKQAQVEALSSEKATLLFRIEAVSRLLEENKLLLSSRDDLESGSWDISDSKLKPLLEDRIRSGGQHFWSLMRQLDTIFSAGAVFLRRNSTAKWWALFYLVSLHLWVIYILMSHSETTVETRSGAVMSLENINNTGGV
ncbi:hypothetical protein PVL29_022040 [Vitis rotundifolia]|uniref:Golgin candidate 2 n=1 Tax=Vitis rotundifolia TaxID=103349 RepID=A0AA38YUG9_VITRO|nr:hypothetical protein PVL29_022040 [Vitis rotundifolia]